MGVETFSAAEWADTLFRLLPPSRYWKEDGFLHKVFLACGDELTLISDRISELIDESDPSSATETLPDYETSLGLVSTGTDAQRQARIIARLADLPGFRPVDVVVALAGWLDLAVGSIVLSETTNAAAVASGHEKEVYRFFVYRDPLLSGTADIDAAQTELDAIAHSHTKGHVIESIDFLCDTATDLSDRDLLGV